MKNYLSLTLIKAYKTYLSPLLPARCRFYPSCSEYALQAYTNFNFFYASWLTLKRLLRCNPFSRGFFDEIPKRKLTSGNPKHNGK